MNLPEQRVLTFTNLAVSNTVTLPLGTFIYPHRKMRVKSIVYSHTAAAVLTSQVCKLTWTVNNDVLAVFSPLTSNVEVTGPTITGNAHFSGINMGSSQTLTDLNAYGSTTFTLTGTQGQATVVLEFD